MFRSALFTLSLTFGLTVPVQVGIASTADLDVEQPTAAAPPPPAPGAAAPPPPLHPGTGFAWPREYWHPGDQQSSGGQADASSTNDSAASPRDS